MEGAATVTLAYDLPVGTDDSYKVCSLRIRVYAEENEQYTINYDWGTEAPEGQRLPSDTNVYDSLEAAQVAVDKTFTGRLTGHKRRQRGNLEIFRLDLFCRKRCSAGYRILVFQRTPACMGDSFLCMVRRWKNLYCQKSMRGE